MLVNYLVVLLVIYSMVAVAEGREGVWTKPASVS